MRSLLLVLPSCQIPKFRQSQPGPDPASFQLNGPPSAFGPTDGATNLENSAQLSINDFYNDQTLERLISQGLAGNRELKMLEEDIQIARAEVLARRGAFLPLVGLRAGAGWDRHSNFTPEGAAERQLEYRPGKHFPTTPGDFMVGFNYIVPIDLWRELRNARGTQRRNDTPRPRRSETTS